LKDAGIEVTSAEKAMIPSTTVKLEGKAAEQMIRFMEVVEDHEDVQNTYSNADIDAAVLEQIAG
jgi:transcriptional/translational regulatory protein YebC/TACO1